MNSKGFGLVGVIVAIGLLATVMLTTLNVIGNINNNVFRVDVLTARDELRSRVFRLAINKIALDLSTQFAGNSTFKDCAWGGQPCVGNQLIPFVLVDLNGVAVTGTPSSPLCYTTAGTPCATQSGGPLIVSSQFKAYCPGGTAQCAVAQYAEIQVLISRNPAFQGPINVALKDVNLSVTIQLPLYFPACSGGTVFNAATGMCQGGTVTANVISPWLTANSVCNDHHANARFIPIPNTNQIDTYIDNYSPNWVPGNNCPYATLYIGKLTLTNVANGQPFILTSVNQLSLTYSYKSSGSGCNSLSGTSKSLTTYVSFCPASNSQHPTISVQANGPISIVNPTVPPSCPTNTYILGDKCFRYD